MHDDVCTIRLISVWYAGCINLEPIREIPNFLTIRFKILVNLSLCET